MKMTDLQDQNFCKSYENSRGPMFLEGSGGPRGPEDPGCPVNPESLSTLSFLTFLQLF